MIFSELERSFLTSAVESVLFSFEREDIMMFYTKIFYTPFWKGQNWEMFV
jgi:hypothetical protein